MKNSIPFPRMCPTCCKKTVYRTTITHVAEIKYESRTYSIEIPDLKVGKCSMCAEVYFDLETDAQIDAAFRAEGRLLTPDQIFAGRKRLGLKQEQLARALDVAKATVNRWENRRLIQSRAMDNLLRAYFHSASFRTLLKKIHCDPSIGVVEADDGREGDDDGTTPVGTAVSPPEKDEYSPPPSNRVVPYFRQLEPGMATFLAQMKQQSMVLPL
jgi:putative zinc finger/helix-turn-helix YgiT family protein